MTKKINKPELAILNDVFVTVASQILNFLFIVCVHYEISFFGMVHRFTNTIATKNPFEPP